MLFAATEWTNQALPPFHKGGIPLLLPALALLLTALTVATYFVRGNVSPWRMIVLLSLRLAALFLVFLLIWRPTLQTTHEDIAGRAQLFILLDASESMNTADEGLGVTRFQSGRNLLDSRNVTDLLKTLAADKRIETKLFQGALDVKPLDASAAPLGKRTEMGQWLADLLAKRGSTPLLGVILLSDGIDNGRKPPLAEAAEYGKLRIPLHTLGLGKKTTTASRSDLAFRDIRVEPAEGVPVKGKMKVIGTLDAPGFRNVPVNVVLSMEDRKTGKMKPVATLKNVPLRADRGNEVTLVADAPDLPGEVKVELSVDDLPGEVNKDNNRMATYVPIEKGGVTILWVEGSPRHEAVFAMRNALGKDKRFRVFYSLKPEGVRADPADDLLFDSRHYDVIVIGDISAKRFSNDNPAVLRKVKEMVEKKTGLLLLGGFESLGESDWQTSGLTTLLPVELERGHHEGQVKVAPTAFGHEYLLKLNDNDAQSKRLWESVLPPLEGANRVGKLKSGATAIAWGITNEKEKFPILATTTYGDGRVVTFAGDTTHQAWIRPAMGKEPSTVQEYGRFWKQLMLWLAHQEKTGNHLRVKLETRRVEARPTEKTPFTVEFRTTAGLPFDRPELSARLVTKTRGEVPLTLTRDKDGNYRGEVDGIVEPGEYAVKVAGKGKDNAKDVSEEVSARFMAYAEDLETSQIAASPDTLEKMAAAGGGEYYPADETKLLRLLEQIATETRRSDTPRDPEYWPNWNDPPSRDASQWDALWNTPSLWLSLVISILFVALISMEWILRRKWGMV